VILVLDWHNPSGIIKGDINMKADSPIVITKLCVRYLDYDNNQLAGGQNIWSLKLSRLCFSKTHAIFYYDHSSNIDSFPLTNIRSGFTLRYNFGN
jgi:hypothetical protein